MSTGGETLIHLRSAKRLVDLRELGKIVPLFEPHGFLHICREAAVNLRRIRDIRIRPSGHYWGWYANAARGTRRKAGEEARASPGTKREGRICSTPSPARPGSKT